MESEPAQPPPPSALPAILMIVGAVALFSVSDTLAKVLRQTLPSVEIAWLRYMTFCLFAAALASRRGVAALQPKRPGLQILRGVTLLGSAVFFIVGLSRLQIAEATAISYVQPAFITALSVIFLGEEVRIRRWTATLVGLLGVLVVVRPGSSAVQVAALYPLASALCWAVAVVITRKMGTSDRTETTLLWSAVTGFLVLTVIVPFDFVPPSLGEAGIGLALGVIASTGQYLIILAYRRSAASVLAPFAYVQLLFSSALGVAVFGTVPDRYTLTGAAIIIASGLYTAHRERVRGRERRETAASDGPSRN